MALSALLRSQYVIYYYLSLFMIAPSLRTNQITSLSWRAWRRYYQIMSSAFPAPIRISGCMRDGSSLKLYLPYPQYGCTIMRSQEARRALQCRHWPESNLKLINAFCSLILFYNFQHQRFFLEVKKKFFRKHDIEWRNWGALSNFVSQFTNYAFSSVYIYNNLLLVSKNFSVNRWAMCIRLDRCRFTRVSVARCWML